MSQRNRSSITLLAAFAAITGAIAGCTTTRAGGSDEHADHAESPAASVSLSTTAGLPADEAGALARLNSSPRHGEYVMIRNGADSLRAWVVFPERKTKAPVVVVVHEIFGLSDWIRSVADQFAADGFIAIAPDFLTTKQIPEGPDSVRRRAVSTAIRSLDQPTIQDNIDAAARYAMALPAALPRYGVVGFCWGGSASFGHAVHAPSLGASVVYYGTSPPSASLAAVKAPVLGLYGGNDARVNATIPGADSTMRSLGKTYEPKIYDGAGHGFLRQQSGQNGANLTATQQAWPATIAWFKRHLGA